MLWRNGVFGEGLEFKSGGVGGGFKGAVDGVLLWHRAIVSRRKMFLTQFSTIFRRKKISPPKPPPYVPPHEHPRHYTDSTNVMVRNNPIQLNLWDTAGDVENDRLRTLSYPGTDIFLCVFSLVDPASLDAIQEKFIPEVQQHVPGCQWLLVGCKSDLRNDADVIKRLKKKKLKPISKEQGEAKAAEWGAAGYQECSALTSKGVKSCFDTAVGLVVTRKDAEAKKKDGKCVIC